MSDAGNLTVVLEGNAVMIVWGLSVEYSPVTSPVFAPTEIGKTSAPIRFWVKNTGNVQLTGFKAATPSVFFVEDQSCRNGGSLDVDERCWLDIRFRPEVEEEVSGALETDTDQQILVSTLSGVGMRP